MPYRLEGILKSPNGQPLTGVDLQFIAQQTLTPVLQQTDHNIRLGLDGSYDVSLEFNTYAVKAQIGGIGAQHMGYIEVNADTTPGLDLPQLLRLQSEAPTAPDYVKMIEGWLNEAKAAADKATAEAASAKAQADRAKSEADRASEISGLETVADAIGLAAVPFPDAWIPFNDSLRMIAGFGRDVKVGDDVVATYVNYERATEATYIDKSGNQRTAAINEPRFEKEGLLIEGQSTNLFLNSEAAANQIISTQAAKYTLSFCGTGSISIAGSSAGVLIGSGVDLRASKAFDCAAGNAEITITGQVTKVQFEKLEFASSYIPTGESAVTRADDKCWIQWDNNISQSMISIVMNYDLKHNTVQRIISYGDLSRPYLVQMGGGGGIESYSGAKVVIPQAEYSAGTVLAVSISNSEHLLRVGSKSSMLPGEFLPIIKTPRVVIGGFDSGSMFGHVRDLRIWHSALSDAQIKGVK